MTDDDLQNDRWVCTLRVTHPSFDIGALLASTGLKPRYNRIAGQERLTPNGNPLSGVNLVSGCLVDMMVAPHGETFEGYLATLLECLETHHDFLKNVNATGGSAELFFGFFMGKGNTGFILDLGSMERCHKLGLELSFEIYGPDLPSEPTGEIDSI